MLLHISLTFHEQLHNLEDETTSICTRTKTDAIPGIARSDHLTMQRRHEHIRLTFVVAASHSASFSPDPFSLSSMPSSFLCARPSCSVLLSRDWRQAFSFLCSEYSAVCLLIRLSLCEGKTYKSIKLQN